MHHRRIQNVIQSGVAHKQSEGAFVAVQTGCHLLHVAHGLVDLGHRRGNVDGGQAARQRVGIGHHAVGLTHDAGQLTVQARSELVQLLGGGGCGLLVTVGITLRMFTMTVLSAVTMSSMTAVVYVLLCGSIWNRISFNLKSITLSELTAGEADENNCNRSGEVETDEKGKATDCHSVHYDAFDD